MNKKLFFLLFAAVQLAVSLLFHKLLAGSVRGYYSSTTAEANQIYVWVLFILQFPLYLPYLVASLFHLPTPILDGASLLYGVSIDKITPTYFIASILNSCLWAACVLWLGSRLRRENSRKPNTQWLVQKQVFFLRSETR